MATKRIKVYFHNRYEYCELPDIYDELDWPEGDERWEGLWNFGYEVAIEVDVDLETGEVTRVAN